MGAFFGRVVIHDLKIFKKNDQLCFQYQDNNRLIEKPLFNKKSPTWIKSNAIVSRMVSAIKQETENNYPCRFHPRGSGSPGVEKEVFVKGIGIVKTASSPLAKSLTKTCKIIAENFPFIGNVWRRDIWPSLFNYKPPSNLNPGGGPIAEYFPLIGNSWMRITWPLLFNYKPLPDLDLGGPAIDAPFIEHSWGRDAWSAPPLANLLDRLSESERKLFIARQVYGARDMFIVEPENCITWARKNLRIAEIDLDKDIGDRTRLATIPNLFINKNLRLK